MEFKQAIAAEIQDLLYDTPRYHIFLDVETTGLSLQKDKILDFQIAFREGPVYFLPASELSILKQIFPKACIVGHNLKFDLQMLYKAGIDLLDNPIYDTLLSQHLINENDDLSLDALVQRYWQDDYKAKFWATYSTYEEAPLNARIEYACKDIWYTRKLWEQENEAIPRTLWKNVHSLQKELIRAELTGLRVDIPYLLEKGTELKRRIEELRPQMRGLVDLEASLVEFELWEKELGKRKTDKGKLRVSKPTFSFDSPKQLLSLFYDKLGLPEQTNDKTKQPSVDDASLEKLDHPVVELLRDYREINKVYTTYIQGTLEKVIDERVYPSFNAAGTVTGRISHSNPNLGNLPRDGGVRGIYIPDPRNVFISADYSSLEVVIEANLTNDKNLIRVLQEGVSKHDITAQELSLDRNTAKTLNFALQYHASAWKVSKLLKIPQKEADKIYARYWEVYAGCRALKDQTDRELDRDGFVINLIGRKRRFGLRKRAIWDGDYRQAYNFKIQGPGADFTNMASYMVGQELRKRNIGRFVLSVHDEIMIEAKETHWQEAEKLLIDTMEGISDIFKLRYRLKAVSSGPMERWKD